MKIPAPRGPVSRWVAQVLHGRDPAAPRVTGPMSEDTHLALWMLYELHYRGFDDAVGDLEWDLRLLAVRRQIENAFEAELRAAPGSVSAERDLAGQLLAMATTTSGPSLALYLQRHATPEQMRDYLRERSLQQLKESDPHSFVLGRLDGPAKVALAELQYDEYGAGRPQRMHARLYAEALAAAGLSPEYGAYFEQVSPATLASVNAMSLFAMHHRLRGAAMGHLAMFEATSSVPCRRIALGLGRLGFPAATTQYFEEHIEADAVHEQLVASDICANLPEALHEDVLLGARVCLHLDAAAAGALLDRWGVSGLREAS